MARKNIKYKKLNKTQQKLAADYVPFARNISKEMTAKYPNIYDEATSDALFALVKSSHNFKKKYKVNFATFAARRIKGSLIDCQRDWLKHTDKYQAMPTDKMPYINKMDMASSCQLHHIEELSAKFYEPIDLAEQLDWWLRKLPPKHREVVNCFYVKGYNQAETAKSMSLSQSRVSYLHREALQQLRDIYFALRDKGEAVPELPFEV